MNNEVRKYYNLTFLKSLKKIKKSKEITIRNKSVKMVDALIWFDKKQQKPFDVIPIRFYLIQFQLEMGDRFKFDYEHYIPLNDVYGKGDYITSDYAVINLEELKYKNLDRIDFEGTCSELLGQGYLVWLDLTYDWLYDYFTGEIDCMFSFYKKNDLTPIQYKGNFTREAILALIKIDEILLRNVAVELPNDEYERI